MKLVVFDVDGTLIDSQHMIVASMNAGFDAANLPHLPRQQVLSIVGLSLPLAIAELLPKSTPAQREKVIDGYRAAYMASRMHLESPLYPGAQDCLDALSARGDVLLAIATGKSRRGLDEALHSVDLRGVFDGSRTADQTAGKPHPLMLQELMAEFDVAPERLLMIGDTTHDLQMAVNAGCASVGVSYGAHEPDAFHALQPLAVVHSVRELHDWLLNNA